MNTRNGLHQKVFNSRPPRIFRISTLLMGFSLAIITPNVRAELSKEVQKACLRAADYQGCVKANMNTGMERIVPDSNQKIQQSQGAVDRFGFPLLDRKRYKGPFVAGEGELYYDMGSIRTLKNKGEYGRYLAWEMVARWIAAPVAPTPGQNIEISGASTQCSGFSNAYANANGYTYGSSFSMNGYSNGYASSYCSTTPGSSYYLPGTPGSAGGPRQILNTFVIDCIDRKFQMNKRGSWKVIDNSDFTQLADIYCPLLARKDAPKGEEI